MLLLLNRILEQGSHVWRQARFYYEQSFFNFISNIILIGHMIKNLKHIVLDKRISSTQFQNLFKLPQAWQTHIQMDGKRTISFSVHYHIRSKGLAVFRVTSWLSYWQHLRSPPQPTIGNTTWQIVYAGERTSSRLHKENDWCWPAGKGLPRFIFLMDVG